VKICFFDNVTDSKSYIICIPFYSSQFYSVDNPHLYNGKSTAPSSNPIPPS